MKKSLKSLVKEFDDQDKDVRDLLRDLFIFEDEKQYVNSPKYKDDYKRIIDAIVDKTK